MTQEQAIIIINLLQGICGILMFFTLVATIYGVYKLFKIFF